MRKLRLNEIEDVSGGIWQWAVGYAASHIVDASIRAAYNYARNPTPVLVRDNDGSDPLL